MSATFLTDTDHMISGEGITHVHVWAHEKWRKSKTQYEIEITYISGKRFSAWYDHDQKDACYAMMEKLRALT